MRPIAIVAVLFLSLPAPASADGPSFDCAKAVTPVEKAICASGDLSALDRQIAVEYPAALSTGQTNTAEQRAWLDQRDKACAPSYETDCLRHILMDRHAFLTSKPEGYKPTAVRGQPGFDCDKIETENEKAICGYQELSELYLALIKAYDAAEQEGFKLSKPGERSRWRKEACKGKDSDDFSYVIACLKAYMGYALKDLSARAAYEDRVPTVRSVYTGGVTYKSDPMRDVVEIAEESNMAPHIAEINADKEFRKENNKVLGCAAMAAVGHLRNNQPEDYRDFAYGGLCTVERSGKPRRELVCIETYAPGIHEMAVGDRPIGHKEIAIFTALNCD